MTKMNSITQQATSHVLSITTPMDELLPKFDTYWDEVKDKLNPSLIKAAKKGGFRKIVRERVIHAAGGKSKFYEPVLMKHVEEFLDTQPRQALVIESVQLTSTETDYNLEAVVYLEPEVTWTKKLGFGDGPLEIKVQAEPANIIEDLINEELQKKQEALTKLVPEVDLIPAKPGQIVSVSCKSYIVTSPGTPEETLTVWEPGTANNAKWAVDSDSIKQPELYSAILSTMPAATVCVDMTLNEKFGSDAGKTIRAILTIHQTFNKITPEINDDLAKAAGYETLELYKQALLITVTDKVTSARAQHRENGIFEALSQVVSIAPVPKQWSVHKGNTLYQEGLQHAKTEQNLLAQFNGAKCLSGAPVVDRDSLIIFLGERATLNLVTDLAIRSWGQLAGVEGDKTLKSMPQYVQAVKVELNNRATEVKE
jgi:FKBP-type peptidyl-prolyl cis-trans isomerase (trigger factor)